MIRRFFVIGALLLSVVITYACQEDEGDIQPASYGTSLECEIAFVTLFDVSESMEEEVNPGQSLLDLYKETVISVFQAVPPNYWNVGVAKFPSKDGPVWGMEILNDTNRPDLIGAINTLTPAGASPMDAGLTLAGMMLATDVTRPRFMVVLSDGEVCYDNECGNIKSIADYMKTELGIFIITVGYDLQGSDHDVMRDIASLKPDGTPAFFNSSSADAIVKFMEITLGAICDFLEVSVKTNQNIFTMVSGGNGTGGYSVEYVEGNGRDVRIVPAGEFLYGGGTVRFDVPVGHLSAENRAFGGKIDIRSHPEMAGDYELVLRAVQDGTDITLGSKTIQTSVVPVTLNLSFYGNVTFNQATDEIEGFTRIQVTTPERIELSIGYLVTEAGTNTSAIGFTYPAPPSLAAEAGSSTITKRFAIRRSGAQAGIYDLHVFVTIPSLGYEQRIVATGISIP